MVSMHGEVIVWQMTEEERLAYIKKHPIIPTDAKGSTFTLPISDERKKQAYENQLKTRRENSVLNKIDINKLHELYMKKIRLADIADTFDVNINSITGVIQKLRKEDPDKWPRRRIERGKRL